MSPQSRDTAAAGTGVLEGYDVDDDHHDDEHDDLDPQLDE